MQLTCLFFRNGLIGDQKRLNSFLGVACDEAALPAQIALNSTNRESAISELIDTNTEPETVDPEHASNDTSPEHDEPHEQFLDEGELKEPELEIKREYLDQEEIYEETYDSYEVEDNMDEETSDDNMDDEQAIDNTVETEEGTRDTVETEEGVHETLETEGEVRDDDVETTVDELEDDYQVGHQIADFVFMGLKTTISDHDLDSEDKYGKIG